MKTLRLIYLVFFLFPWACYGNDSFCSHFPQDCKIRNHFLSLKSQFIDLGVDINFLARYRALRFIDIQSYNEARGQRAVSEIYPQLDLNLEGLNPWFRWSSAAKEIDQLSIDELSSSLIQQIHAYSMREDLSTSFNSLTFSSFRKPLFRGKQRLYEGFDVCSVGDRNCLSPWIKAQREIWETQDLKTPLILNLRGNRKRVVWVYYLKAELISDYIQDWVHHLKKALRGIEQGKLSPVEVALSFQRELVAIHPFRNGNGRTSRFIQDLILKKFSMPFLPSGYLINEFVTKREDYIEDGYEAVEKELEVLDNCLKEYQQGESVSYDCQVID